jgi:hypothetical protein
MLVHHRSDQRAQPIIRYKRLDDIIQRVPRNFLVLWIIKRNKHGNDRSLGAYAPRRKCLVLSEILASARAIAE